MEYQSLEVIASLKKQISDDKIFAQALVLSLKAAKENAADGKLNADLYDALNKLYDNNAWPTTSEDYLKYLKTFAEVIPSENQVPGYTAWNNNDQQNGYSQQVYDRLCQFYWLVDQGPEVGGAKVTLQDYKSKINDFSFAEWLDQYANAWGSFLDTPASMTPETLKSFEDDVMYNLPDYSDDKPNWTTFNKFFFRQLNSIEPNLQPMRPVAAPDDNTIVCSPADCTFKAIYNIDDQGNVVEPLSNAEGITLKHTHTIGTVQQLLNNSPLAERFYGGTFVHYFLNPFDYHRFHVPVAGKVVDSQKVHGNVFLNVEITDNQFDAPDGAGDGYEFTQARGVIIVDTAGSGAGDVGLVATIPIGMAQVSSVHMELQNGAIVHKGDEFGYFAFGGSDIIMVFERPQEALRFVKYWDNRQVNATDAQKQVAPFHFKYGQPSVIFK
ncbi:phosphatidylserine decarboxylase [Roseivirga sp. UBA1976]|uniref:phosphatidylserine decarboxylase n=1 Tax=Roseivirga sp. UBA1976 TaxID=1947386 RepID=UPI00257B6D9F|nr:phosphatidylserine decarboxylase [Roseivirga sp. UBA1976]